MTCGKKSVLGSVCLILTTLACGGALEEPLLQSEEGLYRGTLTCGMPHVGWLNAAGGCTATLVAPDMILTAAHCFNYTSNDNAAPTTYQFWINSSAGCGTTQVFPLKRWFSYGTALGANDVAIAHLAKPVPSTVATPANFRVSMPPFGTAVNILGHGARNYSITPTACGPLDYNKAFSYYNLDGTVSGHTRLARAPDYLASMCPGDSGGPSIAPGGEIFWVSSMTTLSGNDVLNHYGEAWRFWGDGQLNSRMESWTCPAGVWSTGAAVSKDDRYPYARHCGRDFQNYECDHAQRNWRAVGGSCGSTACQCAGGTALGGIAIPASKTSCGSTHCGMDQLVYQCTSSGWAPIMGSRCGPGVAEDFDNMPSWSSTYNAPWGGASSWTIFANGQTGNALRANRDVPGSSAQVRVYSVRPNTTYTVSIYMRSPAATGDYWTEAAFKLGGHTAADFDGNVATWTMIKKFHLGANGNGNVWTRYSRTFNTGSFTTVSVGYKHGARSLPAATARWDTLRIE